MRTILLAISLLCIMPVWAGEADTPQRSAAEVLAAQPYDIVYGDPDSAIRIVEYASLSCGHCKNFYENVVLKLKEEYIDTNKIAFVYRHFPLNAPALYAAQMVNCVDDTRRQKVFIGALFKSQEEWGFEPNETKFINTLQTLASIGGIGADEFQACLDDKSAQEAMLAQQVEAANVLKISGTPAVFFNGAAVKARSYESLKASIDAALAAG